MSPADEDEHDRLIAIVWPLLARPGGDLWERHQAEDLAARILDVIEANAVKPALSDGVG